MEQRIHPRLKGYDYRQNGAYFVTVCCIHHRCLLGTIQTVGRGDDPAGDSTAPSWIPSDYGTVVERHITRIHGLVNYVIMPNHIHMIIQIDDGFDLRRDGTAPPPSSRPTSLSDRVRIFKTLVTKQIGHSIFQTSFHDRIIRNEAEYQKIWRYIEEYPLRWELDKYYQ